MKKALLIAVALILTAGFTACQDEFAAIRNAGESKILESNGAGSSPYFPFEEGKIWRYEGATNVTIDYPDDYIVEDTSWTDSTHYWTEVLGETTLSGSNPLPVWELRSISTYQVAANTTFVYAHIDADSAYFYENIDDSEPWYTTPAEPELGDSWEIIVEYVVDEDTFYHTTYYEVIDDNAEANGYTGCLQVKATPEDVSMYEEYDLFSYMARDVGTVMSTQYMLMVTDLGEDGEMVMTVEGETRLIKGPGIEE